MPVDRDRRAKTPMSIYKYYDYDAYEYDPQQYFSDTQQPHPPPAPSSQPYPHDRHQQQQQIQHQRSPPQAHARLPLRLQKSTSDLDTQYRQQRQHFPPPPTNGGVAVTGYYRQRHDPSSALPPPPRPHAPSQRHQYQQAPPGQFNSGRSTPAMSSDGHHYYYPNDSGDIGAPSQEARPEPNYARGFSGGSGQDLRHEGQDDVEDRPTALGEGMQGVSDHFEQLKLQDRQHQQHQQQHQRPQQYPAHHETQSNTVSPQGAPLTAVDSGLRPQTSQGIHHQPQGWKAPWKGTRYAGAAHPSQRTQRELRLEAEYDDDDGAIEENGPVGIDSTLFPTDDKQISWIMRSGTLSKSASNLALQAATGPSQVPRPSQSRMQQQAPQQAPGADEAIEGPAMINRHPAQPSFHHQQQQQQQHPHLPHTKVATFDEPVNRPILQSQQLQWRDQQPSPQQAPKPPQHHQYDLPPPGTTQSYNRAPYPRPGPPPPPSQYAVRPRPQQHLQLMQVPQGHYPPDQPSPSTSIGSTASSYHGYPAPPHAMGYHQSSPTLPERPPLQAQTHHQVPTSSPESPYYVQSQHSPIPHPQNATMPANGATAVASIDNRQQEEQPSRGASPPPTMQEIGFKYQIAKNSKDPQERLEIAHYILDHAQEVAAQEANPKARAKRYMDICDRALKILAKIKGSGRGGPAAEALFILGSAYSQGDYSLKRDDTRAFELYQQAAKQSHPEATYRTAVCYELGAGCRRDSARAIQFYRKSASQGCVPAMYKLGVILLKGLLNTSPAPREAVTWLKRAAEAADEQYPHALHELALCYEKGGIPGLIEDIAYAKELHVKAAQLGYVPSQVRLGLAYEYGTLGCEVDAASSISWYTKAAEKGDPDAELALSGWYLTGAEPVLPQNDVEAYLWAQRAAQKGLPKAEYAMGYYTESGIGLPRGQPNLEEAMVWYKRAAQHGNKRAIQRLSELKQIGHKPGRPMARPKRGHAGLQDEGCKVM
ncbi:hypothetical protein EV182_000356 [Spiromyces aspiralis]|uniref:Uncharacterized protein n=1 Tax=Spiromyces aspiralis TaxID=68401 RepID=A0ACC1HUL7_9FUNG|nr:hypothetical protein EV182_000356 [Spiromyces aspiralis]